MMKTIVTSKKWGKLSNNRGYGYKTTKVTKYICRNRRNPKQGGLISNSDERFSDCQSQQNTVERDIVGKLYTQNGISERNLSTRGSERESDFGD